MNKYHFGFNEAVVPIAKKLAKLTAQRDGDNPSLADKKIQDLLREHRCKFVDLAGIIERAALIERAAELLKQDDTPTAEEGEQMFHAGYAQGHQAAQAEQGNRPPTWRQMVDICWSNINHLDDKDRAFISSIRPRILFDDDEPSEKQRKWLKDCYRKVHLNGRASV